MRIKMTRALVVSALLTATTAASAVAQRERPLFTWNGRVDSTVTIRMHGDQASATIIGGEHREAGRFQVYESLPRDAGVVSVAVTDGRPDVVVVQQPTIDNDFTTLIRVRDNNGPEHVALTANWLRGRTYSSGEVESSEHARHEQEEHMRRDERANAGLLHFTGDVDNTVVIRWHGDHTDLQNVSGDDPREVRLDVAGAGLPDRDATVRIVKHKGKGDIDVVEQPTAANGYTAVIRVRNKDEGYRHFDFDVVVDR